MYQDRQPGQQNLVSSQGYIVEKADAQERASSDVLKRLENQKVNRSLKYNETSNESLLKCTEVIDEHTEPYA